MIVGLVAALALGLMVAAIAGLYPRISLADLLDGVRQLPFPVFVLVSGLLPLIGVPMTAVYLIAGAVYLPVLGLPTTLLGVTAGVMINLILCHMLASRFQGLTTRLLQRFRLTIPELPKKGLWKLVLMVRITPGAPLVAQNVLLSIAGVPIGIYLAVSAPAELLISAGYLTLGSSFGTGKWQLLIVGAGLVGITLLTFSLLRTKAKKKVAR
jgi:uncharacterized membrane protein YdjX (TVP38/TMEM64 family)